MMDRKLALVFAVSAIYMTGIRDSAATADNSCVSHFLQANVYNWWAFKNGCDEPVHVDFRYRNSEGASGGRNIQPGQSENIGERASDIQEKGGLLWATCPISKQAYSISGARWRGEDDYRCR